MAHPAWMTYPPLRETEGETKRYGLSPLLLLESVIDGYDWTPQQRNKKSQA